LRNRQEVVMPAAEPVISQWYQHRDKGYEFQVTAVDEEAGTVEMQHFDGDLEEVDMDTWYALDVAPIETPEDWTGPMDEIEADDLGYTETDMTDDDWTQGLNERDERLGRGDNEEE